MAYVYVYFDPRKNPPEPIYVGKGQGKRIRDHLGKKCKNVLLQRKIANLREIGLEPIVVKSMDGISHDEAMAIEKQLIYDFGRISEDTGTLCNFTEGGEGTVGYNHKDSTLELFSKQRKGKKQTMAQYEANCKRVCSEEHRKKISKSQIGINRHTEKSMNLLRNQEYGASSFLITFPDGTKQEITNLSKFARNNDLDRTSLTKAATFKTPYKNYFVERL